MVTTRPAAPAFRWGNQPPHQPALWVQGVSSDLPVLPFLASGLISGQGAILRRSHTPRERPAQPSSTAPRARHPTFSTESRVPSRDLFGIRVALYRGNTPLRRSAGATDSPIQPALWVQGVSSDLPVLPCTNCTRRACCTSRTCEDSASLVDRVCPRLPRVVFVMPQDGPLTSIGPLARR